MFSVTCPDAEAPASRPARPHAVDVADVRRFTFSLWLATILAVSYGSLYPLQFAAPPSLREAGYRMLFHSGWWAGTGDVVANVVLFVPVGALSWLILERWPMPLARRALAVLVGGFLFGLALQVLQLWLPRRWPQFSDAVWNGIGLLAGIGLARWLDVPLQRLARLGRSRLRAGYALGALWLALAWWPLMPALSRRQLRWAWQEITRPLEAAPVEMLLPALALAAVLHLLRHAPWRGAAMAAAPALALCGTFFFSAQPPGAVQPVGWMLGAVLGALSWRVPERLADGAVVVSAVAALLALAVLPWGWSDSASPWSWVPLQHTLSEQRVARSLALGWQLFWCAAALVSARRLGHGPVGVATVLTAWLLALETAQRWMPAQQAELTPVLLPGLCLLALRSVGTHRSR